MSWTNGEPVHTLLRHPKAKDGCELRRRSSATWSWSCGTPRQAWTLREMQTKRHAVYMLRTWVCTCFFVMTLDEMTGLWSQVWNVITAVNPDDRRADMTTHKTSVRSITALLVNSIMTSTMLSTWLQSSMLRTKLALLRHQDLAGKKYNGKLWPREESPFWEVLRQDRRITNMADECREDSN